MGDVYDYSSGYPGAQAILDSGGVGVVRYLVSSARRAMGDMRGDTPAEYADRKSRGIPSAWVFEAAADRALSGTSGGIVDAQYAVGCLAELAAPAQAPIHAVIDDYGAGPSDYPALIAYLRGWNQVVGLKRTGGYGGVGPLTAAVEAGVIGPYRWQPTAWSGNAQVAGITLYQYDIRGIPANLLNGVYIDRNRVYADDWGQDTKVGGDVAKWPSPDLPNWFEAADARPNPSQADWQGDRWVPQRLNVTALKTTYQYAKPDTKSAHTRAPINPGEKLAVKWAFEDGDGRLWGVNADGYVVLSGFTPVVVLPHARAPKPAAAKAG